MIAMSEAASERVANSVCSECFPNSVCSECQNLIVNIPNSISRNEVVEHLKSKFGDELIIDFVKKSSADESKLDEFRYRIVITGPIGVGKTTSYTQISKYLKDKYGNDEVSEIREYLDGPYPITGQELLKRYLNGQLSNACFQNYIQTHYINELTSEKMKKKITLFERCMSDSVAIFCNNANESLPDDPMGLNDFDLTMMFRNCCKIDEIAGAPNYFIKNFEFTRLKTDTIKQTVDTIIDIIENDIKSGIRNRVIGLYNTPQTCYERILIRARDGEAAYTQEAIERNCHAYDKLYELIENESSRIRVFDLGSLYRK